MFGLEEGIIRTADSGWSGPKADFIRIMLKNFEKADANCDGVVTFSGIKTKAGKLNSDRVASHITFLLWIRF
jgi:hypothetical protein